jgi:hypothetical protein
MPRKKKVLSAPGRRLKAPKGQAQPAALEQAADIKPPFWHCPLVWVGSIISALVIAIAVALGTGLGNALFSSATSPQPPHGPPVRIEYVSPLQMYHGSNVKRLDAPESQLRRRFVAECTGHPFGEAEPKRMVICRSPA